MVTAVIVAAGRGTRMGSGTDKIFLEIAGRPVVLHTWLTFDSCPQIDHVVLVIREECLPMFETMARRSSLTKPYAFVVGGAERQDSVWNGLNSMPSTTEIVAIQDAARPCTTHETIRRTIESARESGAAVAASLIADTIKESLDGQTISRHLDRANLRAVQTPQTFRVDVIRRAILSARKNNVLFTDDTAACEAIGQPVQLVVGSEPNPKVTVPADLPQIEQLLTPKVK
jgi:2-C-methyl-D-erythritol 4-phosphate cytidylyltransferase